MRTSTPLTEAPRTPHRRRMSRSTSVLLMLVAAGVISGIAGVLSHAAGNNVPASVLTAGGAFAGTLGLLLAVAHYTGER